MHAFSLSLLLPLFPLATAQSQNYFLRLLGGNNITNGALLHRNWTTPDISPVAVPPPYNPADHYYRFDPTPPLDNSSSTVSEIAGSPLMTEGKLLVIPTQPHPGPLSIWLTLSYATNVPSALRMSISSYPESNSMVYDHWTAVADGKGKALLRYADSTDAHRWVAVKINTTEGFVAWAPWWVAPTEENWEVLGAWEFVLVDIELVEATGSVNSSAPGGTN